MENNSIDSLVTDPPAGISFMGKSFDTFINREHFIEQIKTIFKECLRVLKPGAHGLVWAIPRTSHWTATALEDAGFEIRDVVTHIFGSGFPKSHNISKAIDNAAGAEREITKEGQIKPKEFSGKFDNSTSSLRERRDNPSTPEAKQWDGWGTALKPASEHWVLVRKPCAEDTVAKNVLKYGTGGINIDASRISANWETDPNARGWQGGNSKTTGITGNFGCTGERISSSNPNGRFPANLILSHNDDCVEVGTKKVKSKAGITESTSPKGWKNTSLQVNQFGHGNQDGSETVSMFECTPDCAVAELDRQSGERPAGYRENPSTQSNSKFQSNLGAGERGYKDVGGASRFFYVAKPSKREKNEGCEKLEEKQSQSTGWSGDSMPLRQNGTERKMPVNKNIHPTVKSTKLMSYLINMVTPPNGVVLDPFMGSGSTGVAAEKLEFKFIGIEKEDDYFKIAEARINDATQGNRKLL